MSSKKNIITVVVLTALATCLLTNVCRDLLYLNRNGKILDKLDLIASHIKKDGFYEVDEEKLTDYAAIGMALSIEDPYTKYYPKDQFESYMTNIKSSYVGLGVVLGIDQETEHIVVVSADENGPGARAGIQNGDYILAVDGTEYDADRFQEAVNHIRGEGVDDQAGAVKLRIQHADEEPFEVEVQRETIQKETVQTKMLTEGIGYLRISSFDARDPEDERSKDTLDEFRDGLKNLQNQGMEKLILDLRENPGGALSVVTEIADLLLPEGVITYTEDKNGKRISTHNSDKEELALPMAVLINGNSASAAEVLTGALKDYKKATVIGTKTYGKGVVQSVIPFSDGSGMSITTARYFSPNGVCIQDIGIEPDIEVLPLEGVEKSIWELTIEEDLQLQKAVEVLK